jgi:phage shock protein A
MPVKKEVKNNVTNDVNIWESALRDAEQGLEKAQRVVASWKATIRTCQRRLAEDAEWPGTQSESQNSDPCHSV